MALIDLKFSPDMAEAVLDGRKCCTSRSERKGAPGDEFEIEGVRFRIVDVKEEVLAHIGNDWYRLEGVDSPEAFERLWRSLHRGHYSLMRYYFVHFFARCPA